MAETNRGKQIKRVFRSMAENRRKKKDEEFAQQLQYPESDYDERLSDGFGMLEEDDDGED